jgi:tubulin epsilon
MTQCITIQVGQCGNQIGCRFWDLALREHAKVNKNGCYDDALGTFFRNVDTRYDPPADVPIGDGRQPIASLKARAVLVDMEEGVINETLKGPLGDVFDSRQQITSVSGCGNNWAVGHYQYGPQYRESILEAIQRAAEKCDCLQSFLIMHSIGGGTGSGLGSYIVEMLKDEFPEVYRFVTAVFPSEDDDVVTSPYNSVLATHQLIEYADCVLPVENQALIDICDKINEGGKLARARPTTAVSAGASALDAPKKPFDSMNNIVANMLLHLTASPRFEGALNVDINEITMNLVPFPRMHFLVPSLTPLYALADVACPPRRLDQMFTDAFSREYQLIRADPRRGMCASVCVCVCVCA